MVKSSFTTSDGLKLAFQDEGEGTPVLCLSGLTRNGNDFDYVAPYLSNVRLIRLDYRGRGASDWDENFNNYSIPVEARDAVELLDHLNIDKAAILGTSRGGLIAMVLAATVKDRLVGICLNDIGPQIATEGLGKIMGYVGRNPTAKTMNELIAKLPTHFTEFGPVPDGRWQTEAEHHYRETAEGLKINYDPALRDALIEAAKQPPVDLWPLFDAMNDLPLALIRGANSDLLSMETTAEMQRRRPDMIFTNVPDRGHIPFLDEVESLTALNQFIRSIT